jgi:hypothetical protein
MQSASAAMSPSREIGFACQEINMSREDSSVPRTGVALRPDAPQVASRRSMLFGASAAAAAGAAAYAVSRGLQPSAGTAVVEQQASPEKGGGYHVTPRVLHYYATTLV